LGSAIDDGDGRYISKPQPREFSNVAALGPITNTRVLYRRINYAISETTALTISIVVIEKRNFNLGRSLTMSPGR
jgi:hypothetical protein